MKCILYNQNTAIVFIDKDSKIFEIQVWTCVKNMTIKVNLYVLKAILLSHGGWDGSDKQCLQHILNRPTNGSPRVVFG